MDNIDLEKENNKVDDFIDSLSVDELEYARERIITREARIEPLQKKGIHSLITEAINKLLDDPLKVEESKKKTKSKYDVQYLVKKYAEDPEFREKQKAKAKEYYKKNAQKNLEKITASYIEKRKQAHLEKHGNLDTFKYTKRPKKNVEEK